MHSATLKNAEFTLSLDCEGLWGMADQDVVVQSKQITQASLGEAYRLIFETLDRNNVKATMAFVTCFAAGKEAIQTHREIFNQLTCVNPSWFRNIIQSFVGNDFDGWEGNKFFLEARRYGHEIAWHGTTHQSLHDSAKRESIDLELQLTASLFKELDIEPQSIVFPRNIIGQLTPLRDFGFNCYRDALPGGFVNRIKNLANEFNMLDSAVEVTDQVSGAWKISPAGQFLNWPSGARSMVPTAVTVRKWKSLLGAAVKNGGRVHMWFHPHNLITAPAMADSFVQIMDEVGRLSKSGDLSVTTMA